MNPDDEMKLRAIELRRRDILAELNSPMTKERDRFLQDEQKKLDLERLNLVNGAQVAQAGTTNSAQPSPGLPPLGGQATGCHCPGHHSLRSCSKWIRSTQPTRRQ